jgi:predicted transcriptional regulator
MTPSALKSKLASLGLTQARAAAYLGVSTRAVEYWLAGKRKIPHMAEIALNAFKEKR